MGLPETLTLNSGTERVGLAILKQFHHFIWRLCNPDIIVLRSPNRRMALGEAYIRRKLRYHRRPRSRVPPRL